MWRRFFAKCVFAVTMMDVGLELECGIEQLCSSLNVSIERGVYNENYVRDNEKEYDIGFLFMDAWDAFREGNLTKKLWTARHL